jgi:hypothetical protein
VSTFGGKKGHAATKRRNEEIAHWIHARRDEEIENIRLDEVKHTGKDELSDAVTNSRND